MEHVVFFPAADGAPAFRRVPSLEEAVRLVEHLRNVEAVSNVSVHSLSEVPVTFRAYYKVEVPGAVVPAQAVAEAPVLEAVPVEAPLAQVEAAYEAPAEPLAVDVPAVEVEPLHEAPALALVEDAPAEDAPAQDEPAEEPVLVASNGHNPQSLGFFA